MWEAAVTGASALRNTRQGAPRALSYMLQAIATPLSASSRALLTVISSSHLTMRPPIQPGTMTRMGNPWSGSSVLKFCRALVPGGGAGSQLGLRPAIQNRGIRQLRRSRHAGQAQAATARPVIRAPDRTRARRRRLGQEPCALEWMCHKCRRCPSAAHLAQIGCARGGIRARAARGQIWAHDRDKILAGAWAGNASIVSSGRTFWSPEADILCILGGLEDARSVENAIERHTGPVGSADAGGTPAKPAGRGVGGG